MNELDAPQIKPTYDNELTPEQAHELVGQLYVERPPQGRGRFAYYELTSDSAYANVARTIEAKAFNRYFHESPGAVRTMYGPYEQQSRFILGIDTKTLQPLGSLRVVTNGENGLLTINDLVAPPKEDKPIGNIPLKEIMTQHDITDLDECWDIGTIAASLEYANKPRARNRIAVMLYRAMYTMAMKQGIKHIVSIVDKHPYEGSMLPLGIPFGPLAGLDEPFRYYGSKLSYAVHGYLEDFYPRMHEYRQSWKGRGIDVASAGALTRLIEGSRDTEINLLP